MYLVRMIYVSSLTPQTDSAAMQAILNEAQANNDKHGLSGLLVFNRHYFLQVIEGGRDAVSRLLGNLCRDPRHLDFLMLGLEQTDRREFPDWSMRFVPAESATREILLRHGVSREFDPHRFTFASALGFLQDMHAQAQSAPSA